MLTYADIMRMAVEYQATKLKSRRSKPMCVQTNEVVRDVSDRFAEVPHDNIY